MYGLGLECDSHVRKETGIILIYTWYKNKTIIILCSWYDYDSMINDNNIIM